MTETPPPQGEHSEPPHGGTDQRIDSGVDRGNLRSYERLRRSTTDRKVAGVAGGLGRHLNIDPTVIRVLLVVLIFFGGAGLVLYGAAWLIVPEDGSDRGVVETSPSTRNALLIVAAVLAAMLLVGDSWGGFGFPWPLLLLALIVFAVLVNRDRSGTSAVPAPPAQPSSAADPPVTEPTAGVPTGWEPPTAQYPPYQTGYPQPEYRQPEPPKPDRGPKLFGFTLAFVALAVGALGLYDAAGGSVVAAAYPALALAVIGVMLVWGSFQGRPGGLIFLGVVAAIALAVTSASEDGWGGENRVVRTPLTAQSVQDSYDLGAGRMILDLTEVRDLENLDGRAVSLDAGPGEITVEVPEGIDVHVNGDIAIGGEIRVDGVTREGGPGVELDRTVDGGADVPELDLNIDLLVGRIEVIQEEAA
jgi:phage shock protein PspC (stress-responsive transcriptional regulator)